MHESEDGSSFVNLHDIDLDISGTCELLHGLRDEDFSKMIDESDSGEDELTIYHCLQQNDGCTINLEHNDDVAIDQQRLLDNNKVLSEHVKISDVDMTDGTDMTASCMVVDETSGLFDKGNYGITECRAKLETDKDGDSILHILIAKEDERAIEIIKHAPADIYGIDLVNNFGQTALHLAMYIGNAQCVKSLLQRNADISILDSDGNTPLHIGCIENSIELVTLLLERNQKSESKEPFHGICQKINQLNGEGRAAFHIATNHRSIEIMKLLVKHGSDVNVRDGHSGKTSLILALECALRFRSEEAIKFAVLLVTEFRVNVNIETHAGYSPLHYACLMNCKEMVALLLERDAEVGEKTIEKKTEKDLATDPEIKRMLEKILRKKRRKRKKTNSFSSEDND